MIRGKIGAERWLSPYWFAMLFIITGAIVYIVISFFGKPIDIRSIEANELTNKVADCLSSGGLLNANALSADFQNNFLQQCNINFSVEDFSDWKNSEQYYTEFSINKFDSSIPNDFGVQLLNAKYGNPNLKTAYIIEQQKQIQAARKVDLVVIHYTESTTARDAIDELAKGGGEFKSIHYLIDRDGTVYSYDNVNEADKAAFRPESQLAGHAGCLPERLTCHDETGKEKPNPDLYPQDKNCCWNGVNSRSIGIELVNLGTLCGNSNNCKNSGNAVTVDGQVWENFTEAQIDSLVNIVSGVVSRYNIPVDRNHIIGHNEVDPGRKLDPGVLFPWTNFINRVQEQYGSAFWAGRNFYAVDSENNQYAINILSIVGKKDKNEP